MPFQETVHFLRQLLAYPFGRCNFFDARFAQSLHGTDVAQEKTLTGLTRHATLV